MECKESELFAWIEAVVLSGWHFRQGVRQHGILRHEKSFCKNMRKASPSFRKFLRGFRDFFEAFGHVRTHSDPFGRIRKQLKTFGRFPDGFRFVLRFFGFWIRFSMFSDVIIVVIFRKNFSHGTILWNWILICNGLSLKVTNFSFSFSRKF